MFFIYISKVGNKEYKTLIIYLFIKSFKNYYKLNIFIIIYNLLIIIFIKIKDNFSNKS